MKKSFRTILMVSSPVTFLLLFFILLLILPANARQTHELGGVLMSGSGDGGFWTSSISLFNPDTTRLHQVSVTTHYWGSSGTNSDSLQGVPRGSMSGGTRASSWNPSLSPSGRMVFVVDWFRDTEGAYTLVAQNRDATDRVIIGGKYPAGGGETDREYRPSISPDGENVIFTVGDGTFGSLYIVPSDGSEEPRLFEFSVPEDYYNSCYGQGNVIQAVYSPDGSEIAYLGFTSRSFEGGFQGVRTPAVCVMNADGSNNRVLYADQIYGYRGWHQVNRVIDWKADRILFAKASWGVNAGFAPRYELKIIEAGAGGVVLNRPMAMVGPNVVRSSFQLSPDGLNFGYALHPAGLCWIMVENIETGEIVFDLTNRLNTGQYCYFNWSAADPVPEPGRFELSEEEVVLWNGQTAHVYPTLYDVDGNVIVHEARKYTGELNPLQIQVNRLENIYYGRTTNVINRQNCAQNAGFEACVTLWNAETPIVFMSAPVDTAYEAGRKAGLYRIHRIGNPRPVMVSLYRSGTAQIYRDYILDHPSLFMAFEEGVYERFIQLIPIENGVLTANRVARLSFWTGSGYNVYTPNSSNLADITIIDSGISASDLAVSGVSPVRGTVRGTSNLKVAGRAFEPGTKLYLQRGSTRIEATGVTADRRTIQSSISGKVDLRGQALGFWDVVVETPGGATAVLPDGFEIIPEQEFRLFSGVYGNPFVSIRALGHNYRVKITNAGDSDVYDVLAFINLSNGVEGTITNLPEVEYDEPEFNNDFPQFLDRGDFQIAPVWIYRLPARESIELNVHVRVPAELLGTEMVLGVTHRPPNPDEDFSWTGIFDEQQERLPWNIGVMLGMMQQAALEFNENVMQSIKNGGTGEIMICPPPPSPPTDGGCKDSGSGEFTGNQADDAFNLAMQLQNDRKRMFNAVSKSAEFGTGQVVIALSKLVGGKVGECIAKHVVHRATGMSSSKDFARELGFTGGGNGIGGGSGDGGGEKCPPVVTSWDPNDKLGIAGVGEGRHIRELDQFPYQIRFENVDSATAPAQIVVITDTLDLAVFDVNTFRLGGIEIADVTVVEPPYGATSYVTTVDLRPEKNLLVHTSAHLERNDEQNFARVVWILTTLNPATNQLPEDPMAGFLPPNKSAPEGEGSVRFYISPHQFLGDGTRISNHAEIVFDSNPPIVTPVWTNTVDLSPPGSEVMLVEATDTAGVYIVTWDGSDAGSGIRSYGIFVQQGDGPFELWKESRETSGIFRGEPDTHYGFFAMAIDRVGNVEPGKTSAEAVTPGTVSVSESDLPRVFALHANYPNPFNPVTVIPYDLPEDAWVRITVYDVLGRRVYTVVNAQMQAGRHAATFDAARLSSGAYIYRIEAGSYVKSRKMMLVK